MGEIRVGTAGWHYPKGRGTWNGVFYPSRRPRGFDELAYYAEHFDTVEVNATFYRMPEPAMCRSWLARTPETFAFAIKLFQKFTHPDMYLARAGRDDWNLSRADVDQFLFGIEPVAAANRLCAVLLQFPPSFHAMPETRDYLDWLLTNLTGHPLAVELRHHSWSDESDRTAALLAGHDAAWVLIDEPKFKGSVRQALEATGQGLTYVRFHGRNASAWWDHDAAEDRYDYLYSGEELEPYVEVAQRAATDGRRVLLYLNNHFSAKAVANAALLKHQLGHLVPGDYPAEMVARYPNLGGIVATAGLPL